MPFIKKLFVGLKTNNQEQNNSMPKKELTTLEADAKLRRTKELAQIANKTTDREEFYNSINEIKDILRELAKYEGKLPFTGSPSADLRQLERIEQSQIELLEKRIAEKEESHKESGSKVIDKKIDMRKPVVLKGLDEYFVNAGRFVIQQDKASIGMIQRTFKMGFNRAALIMDQLAENGIVGEEEGTKPRKILMTAEMFEQYIEGYIAEDKGAKGEQENLIESFQDPEIILKDNLGILADFSKDGDTLKFLKNFIIPSALNEKQTEIINMLLEHNSPTTMSLILIDDSVINYSIYNGAPQLIIPVVTEKKKIDATIHWCFAEMEDRIKKFVENGVKNIDSFNQKMADMGENPYPKIVCVVNESNNFFEAVSMPLERIFLNSNMVGIYFILFSRFSLKSLSLGIKRDILEVFTADELHILLSQTISAHDKKNVIKSFDDMEGHQFEEFCAELLRQNDFENVEVTQGSGDHGIDILVEKDDITYAIQCKCYSSDIGNAAVQQAHTGKSLYHRDIAVVMTNRYFTSQAIEEATALGVKLWDRNKLNEMTRKKVNEE